LPFRRLAIALASSLLYGWDNVSPGIWLAGNKEKNLVGEIKRKFGGGKLRAEFGWREI
jgi:hypothetical protein